jgi:beta-glucanase (GH16 family)
MANIAIGKKYFLFPSFSSIPKTSAVEAERVGLVNELEEFISFETSQELKDFYELEKYIHSKEHKDIIQSVENARKKELNKVHAFEELKKSKKFREHFKFKNSSKLHDHIEFGESSTMNEFLELEKLVTSKEFKAEKQKLENQKATEEKKAKDYRELKNNKSSDPKKLEVLEKYISSDEHLNKLNEAEDKLSEMARQLSGYERMKKSSRIKKYFIFESNQKYRDFKSFEKSPTLANYYELEQYLSSDEHKSLMDSLNEKEEKEIARKNQFEAFKGSKKYNWYLDLKKSSKFDEINKWKLVFEDQFEGDRLDKEKWITRYLWGHKLINDAYAFENDVAFPTDGQNIEVNYGTLKIVTRRERVTGKVWKVPFGFIPGDFDYTTGLISSAVSHRQKFGKIEAKIKINFTKPVQYNFWMVSENNIPHIDILKVNKKKTLLELAHVMGTRIGKDHQRFASHFKGLDLSQDYFIYTLLWSKDKLTWKINGITVHEQTQRIPQEEMYLVFSCKMTEESANSSLPAFMEVDWVKCYQQV